MVTNALSLHISLYSRVFSFFPVEKYKSVTANNVQKNATNAPKVVSSNPLDNLDCEYSLISVCSLVAYEIPTCVLCVIVESDDFKKGVEGLARMLNITCHPDHLITLQAVSKLICERLNNEALQNPSSIIPKVCISFIPLSYWYPDSDAFSKLHQYSLTSC